MGKSFSGYKNWGFFLGCFVTLISFFGVMAASGTSLAATPQIAAGSRHAVALKSDGTVWAWGENSYGQCGTPNDYAKNGENTPVKVSALSNVTAVAGGGYHSLALKSDGTVWAWGGSDYYSQLGNGTTGSSPTPVQVSSLSSVTAIAGGVDHSLALKSDGTVWAWGYNGDGQLGDGTTTNRNTPVQVSGLSSVIAIAGGGYHSLAMKSDGTVWAWGKDNAGQIGDGGTTGSGVYRKTPVQVFNLSKVTVIAGGEYHSLAMKSDGTVWFWGDDYGPTTGTTYVSTLTPVQVSSLSNVTAIVGGKSHSLVLKSDGTVLAWGSNDFGKLGNGTYTDADRDTPVQVSSLSNVIAIAAGFNHSLSLKSDGSVWSWGNNEYGELGDGTNTQRTTPVQVSNINLGITGTTPTPTPSATATSTPTPKSSPTPSSTPTPNMVWGPATLLETGTGTASAPMIAVEPNGNVMAVWVQWDEYGTSYHIYANRYVVGSGWGSPNLLETSDLAVYKPRIAADSNGNAIAVWQQTWTTFGERFSIYANRYVAGTGWGAATAVYEDKKDWLSATGAPRIAVDPNGNAMAVWSLYDSTWSHTSVWASRYVVGTGWSSATNLSGDVVQTAYGADVALDSIGNAIVVWYQASGTSNSVAGMYADRYTVGTGWGTPEHIGTSEGSWAAPGPRIAVDPNGNAIAVWYASGKPGISANRYVAGTGWGTAEAIIDSGSTSYSEDVQVACDKNGNAIAVWNHYGGKLYANRYVAGTGWGTTDIVDSEGQDYSEQIAFDPNGNAIAVWGKYASNSSNVWASRYVVGAGWGAGAIVNTTLDKASEPQIVIDKNGNATVVWVQNGSIYASNGSLATPTPTPSPSPSSTPSPTPSPTSTPSGTGIVFGYVNDEDENYLEGVAVTIAGNGYSDSVNTDEDGYYEFDDVPAGDYTVTYTKTGYETQTQEVTVEEGDEAQLASVTMVAVQKGSISGYVTDIRGNPIESVRLKLSGIRTKIKKSTSTDSDGFFEFTDLDAGTYRIVAKKKFYKAAQKTVVVEEGEDVEIEIEMKKTKSRKILPGEEEPDVIESASH